MEEKKLSTLILVIVIGMIIGGVLGQLAGNFLPESTSKSFLISSYSPSFGFNDDATLIDLYVIQFKIGLKFTFNIISLIGLLISVWLFKWYR